MNKEILDSRGISTARNWGEGADEKEDIKRLKDSDKANEKVVVFVLCVQLKPQQGGGPGGVMPEAGCTCGGSLKKLFMYWVPIFKIKIFMRYDHVLV